MQESKVHLYALLQDQCDRKKCTSLKMKKYNLISTVHQLREIPRKTIILDPFADKILNYDDKPIVEKFGLAVIDCSWNKIEYRIKKNFKTGRKLPNVLAANSTNYGKWNKLNSAEAIIAALIIIKRMDLAKEISSKFSWGATFIEINKDNLK